MARPYPTVLERIERTRASRATFWEFNVVIPFNRNVLENHGTLNGTLSGTLNGTLNDKEQMIVKILLEDGGVTYDDITRKTGISRRTLTRVFSALQKNGVIERLGSKRNGKWIVVK